jgi:hypothetical protein
MPHKKFSEIRRETSSELEARARADLQAELSDDRCPTCGSDNPAVFKLLPRARSRTRRLLGRPPLYVACPDPWHDRQGM